MTTPVLWTPRRHFDANVPEQFQRDALQEVRRAYADARNELVAAGYPPEEMHDLFPHTVRARVEMYLRGLAPRYLSLVAVAERNRHGNASHTRLQFGNAVWLTASAVESPTTLVREAQFRNEYAGAQTRFTLDTVDNQLRQIAPSAPAVPKALLYAILIHGAQDYGFFKPERFMPAFIHVVFLNREGDEYLDRIDLIARYPVASASTVVPEEVRDQAFPELRLPAPSPEPADSKQADTGDSGIADGGNTE